MRTFFLNVGVEVLLLSRKAIKNCIKEDLHDPAIMH